MYTCCHLLSLPSVPSPTALTSRSDFCVFPAPEPPFLEFCHTTRPLLLPFVPAVPISVLSSPVALAAVTCDIPVPVVPGLLSPHPVSQVSLPSWASAGLRQRECGAWLALTLLGPRQSSTASAPPWIWAHWALALFPATSTSCLLSLGSQASPLALQSGVMARFSYHRARPLLCPREPPFNPLSLPQLPLGCHQCVYHCRRLNVMWWVVVG